MASYKSILHKVALTANKDGSVKAAYMPDEIRKTTEQLVTDLSRFNEGVKLDEPAPGLQDATISGLTHLCPVDIEIIEANLVGTGLSWSVVPKRHDELLIIIG